MVWNDYLNMMKFKCYSAAVLGLETELCFTTRENGLKLSGIECSILTKIIKDKSINNKSVIIEGQEYEYKSFDEKENIYTMFNKDKGHIIIAVTKMVILIGFSLITNNDYNDCLEQVKYTADVLKDKGI